MNKKRLGNSELMVSEMGLGCMSYGGKIDEPDAMKLIDAYIEQGGNLLDTANIYGRSMKNTQAGDGERMLGHWLKASGKRDKVVLASKVGFAHPGIEYGTTRKQILEECDKTLQKLGVDYLDLYYLHTDDRDTPMEESLGAMQELIEAGKVRYIGASNFSAWRLERARAICEKNNWQNFCCIQQRYSYLRPKQDSVFQGQKYVDIEMKEYVEDTGITLLSYCPLIKGAYVNDKGFPGQYVSQDSKNRLAVLEEVSKESGISKTQLVYYWLMHSKPGAIPLISPSNEEQLADALGTLKVNAEPYMQRLTEAAEGYMGPEFRTTMKQ